MELIMARKDPQINFRLPEQILEQLKEETQKEHRTLTAQLNMIIGDWLEGRKPKEVKA